MNPVAILSLISDLYAQVTTLSDQLQNAAPADDGDYYQTAYNNGFAAAVAAQAEVDEAAIASRESSYSTGYNAGYLAAYEEITQA